MDIYASDEEKGEEIKQWWRDNSKAVFVVCVFGGAVLLGGRYWLNLQKIQTASASVTYQYVINLLSEDKVTEAVDKTNQLLSEFSSTPYAVFAAFEMAKQSASNDDLSATKSYLEWIITHAKLIGQVEIARLRLAQVLLNQAEYQQALALTEHSQSTAFTSLFSELRGDIYIAQGQIQQAREAYQSALLHLSKDQDRKQRLTLKLDDITGS